MRNYAINITVEPVREFTEQKLVTDGYGRIFFLLHKGNEKYTADCLVWKFTLQSSSKDVAVVFQGKIKDLNLMKGIYMPFNGQLVLENS